MPTSIVNIEKRGQELRMRFSDGETRIWPDLGSMQADLAPFIGEGEKWILMAMQIVRDPSFAGNNQVLNRVVEIDFSAPNALQVVKVS